MKVLVTGAAGFVGNYIISYLREHHPGVKIIASSRSSEKAAECPWFHEVTHIPFDYHQPDKGIDLYRHFHQPDVLIHLAWSFLPMFKAPEHQQIELPSQFRFLSNLVTNGLKNITITGTCYEYGLQEGCLDESTECRPVVPYASAKLELLAQLKELQVSRPFNLCWARLFFMYGKGQSPKSLIPQLEQAIKNGDKVFNMSKGDQERDYLHISKVAEYVSELALLCMDTGVVNCCSGKPMSVATLVEEQLAKHSYTMELNKGFYPYPDYEPFRFWGNDKKLKQLLNR